WIGLQNYKEKFRVIQQHHLLILPSHDENFANVVIESLAMGTAVLLSEKVGLAQYVKENNWGWVSHLHPDAFCKHLENIFYQKDQLQAIRQKAPEKIRTDFNSQRLLEDYLQFYRQILEHE
ncbi:MAG TPA: glycosyltransferase, partial [Daejeonella sp.]|nr:glycosyltransferase [Daejeonella sp.]